jgi:hypothetical protein
MLASLLDDCAWPQYKVRMHKANRASAHMARKPCVLQSVTSKQSLHWMPLQMMFTISTLYKLSFPRTVQTFRRLRGTQCEHALKAMPNGQEHSAR